MTFDEANEAVCQIIDRWAGNRLERRKSRGLDIETAEVMGPMQVILASVFEERRMEYETRPAVGQPAHPSPPDPWDYEVEHEDGTKVGSVQKINLEETVHLGCSTCTETGKMACDRCGGGGVNYGHGTNSASRQCGSCTGNGRVTCTTCTGSGSVYGKPTVCSMIKSVEVARLVEAGELPNDVYIHLGDVQAAGSSPGDVVHSQTAPRIEELGGDKRVESGGYRSGARETPEAVVARELCANSNVPNKGRLVEQTLVIRQVPVYRVRAAQTGDFWVVGGADPAVFPESALRSMTAKLLVPTLVASVIAGLVYAVL